MHHPIHAESPGASTRQQRAVGYALAVVGVLLFALNTAWQHNLQTFGIDFRFMYASAHCFVHADCDPWSEPQTMQRFLDRGGPLAQAGPAAYGPFRPYNSEYPPQGYSFLAPFTVFHWPLAWIVWIAFSLAVFLAAVLLVANLSAQYAPIATNLCMVVFLALGTLVLVLAQPALLVVSLCIIGIWSLLTGRATALGVFCFGWSLAFKPQLGGLFWLYFLLAGGRYRRPTLQIAAVAIALCIPGIVWASVHPTSAHWLSEMDQNIRGIMLPGNANSVLPSNREVSDLANLQSLTAIVSSRAVIYNGLAWIICIVVAVAWLRALVRTPSSHGKNLLAIAFIACFTLLPVYHRNYDARILLLTFPALAWLLALDRITGYIGAALTLLASLMVTDWYFRMQPLTLLKRLLHRPLPPSAPAAAATPDQFAAPALAHSYSLPQMFLRRPVPIALLILAIFYVVALWRQSSRSADAV